MSSLSPGEKRDLEELLGMSGGYVLTFTNRTFADFVQWSVEKDIDAGNYAQGGSSKANRLRQFWRVEDDAIVGKLVSDLLNYMDDEGDRFATIDPPLIARCRAASNRLLAGAPDLRPLHEIETVLDASYVQAQVRRVEIALRADSTLALGTAKEMVETVCKTILRERGKPPGERLEISDLTKLVLEEIDLSPAVAGPDAKGSDYSRRLLRNLAAIPSTLAELRNLHGTGHGKDGQAPGIHRRHAELAVGAAGVFCRFVVDAHKAQPVRQGT
jgi:hypothetical protein